MTRPMLLQVAQQAIQRAAIVSPPPPSAAAIRNISTRAASVSVARHPVSTSNSTSAPLIHKSYAILPSNALLDHGQPLSTAAVEQPSRKQREKKDPITITPSAAERIQTLLSGPNAAGAIGIRLGVKRRGCNGLSYTLNYAHEKKTNEEEMTSHGVTVFIEPMALFNVVGTVMDWEETEMSSEFTFNNPNSKGECGCGESFNV